MQRSDIPVEIPCNQRWSTMTREGQKRFCDSCKKHVHDLSAMTPSEAKTVLDSESTAGLCVRYLYDEAGNVLFRPSDDLVAPSALTRMRRFVTAAGILAVPLTLNACMGAKMPGPPPVAPPPSAVTTVSDVPDASAVLPVAADASADAAMPVTPVAVDAPMEDGPPYRAR